MYHELLEDVAAWRRENGRDLQPPATDAALADLRRRARSELRYAIPAEYEAFLRKTDGLDANGISLYGSSRTLIVGTTNRFVSGLVEANLFWRKGGAFEDQVIFANDSLTHYVWHLDDEAWELRSSPSDDLLEKVASFEELVFRALDRHRPSREQRVSATGRAWSCRAWIVRDKLNPLHERGRHPRGPPDRRG